MYYDQNPVIILSRVCTYCTYRPLTRCCFVFFGVHGFHSHAICQIINARMGNHRKPIIIQLRCTHASYVLLYVNIPPPPQLHIYGAALYIFITTRTYI